MEATATESATASQTIADLIPSAAARHGERVAVRYKRDGAWHDLNYTQLAEIVNEVGLGLIDLGLQPGERVCILANTRPEWSYADMGATSAGAIVVPIYQTNSPEECLWVISDSEASMIFVENEEQLAKIVEIRDRVPNIRSVIIFDPPAHTSTNGSGASPLPLDAVTLEQLRERGRGRPAEELDARRAGVSPEDPFTFIYTSGTTGPPKGCVLTHGNYRAMIDIGRGRRGRPERRGLLPVPPPGPLLRAADPAADLRPRRHAGVLRRRHQADRPRAAGGQTDLPAVGAAGVREDLHDRPRRDRGQTAGRARAGRAGDQARHEGPHDDAPRRRGPRGRDARPSKRPTRSCSKTSARSSAATSARPPAAPPRSPARSSSSSSPAGCRCSRATG